MAMFTYRNINHLKNDCFSFVMKSVQGNRNWTLHELYMEAKMPPTHALYQAVTLNHCN